MARAAPKKQGLGRRQLFGAGFGAVLSSFARSPLVQGLATLATACDTAATLRARGPVESTPARSDDPFEGPVRVWSVFDLPREVRSRELSGIAWDEAAKMLWAVQDDSRTLVSLVPDPSLKSWGFGPTIPIDIEGVLDLEGVVVTPSGFIVADEETPRIVELARDGRVRMDIPVPARFKEARHNKNLESLTMSPSQRYLFTTSESTLEHDGPMADVRIGAHLRIVRFEARRGQVSEHAYATDPAPHAGGDYGVADLCAIGDEDLLVLERGFTKGSGNTVRLYRVSLDAGASCIGVSELQPDAPMLAKTLFVDLGRLECPELPPIKQPQASPLLDNFEGLAVGPRLPDGRRSLILVADDNGRSDQFARVLVLAVGDGPAHSRKDDEEPIAGRPRT